ncbi:MAG: hypothetical protein ACK58T_41530 [Phycisphaerae bacterium]
MGPGWSGTGACTSYAPDVGTIAFVGDRYAWSAALLALDVGENELTEPEAWRIKQAFESDMEGGTRLSRCSTNARSCTASSWHSGTGSSDRSGG